MGESEWKNAGWVSGLGKWAWIIVLINGIIGLLSSIVEIITYAAAWAIWGFAVTPGVPGAGISFWNVIASIVGIVIAVFIIRPKFSKPCGEKDWDALYGWTLKLGGAYVPWMFIWGILLFLFGWYGWGALVVLLPAIMLIWFGPEKYDWKAE
jgi:hypothetical protein